MTVNARADGRGRAGEAEAVGRSSVQDVVRELVEALGPLVVAYIGGAADTKTVRAWSEGTSAPGGRREAALRGALRTVRILVAAEDPVVARAWFIGVNPYLDRDAPAAVLRRSRTPEDVARVVRAAYTFTL